MGDKVLARAFSVYTGLCWVHVWVESCGRCIPMRNFLNIENNGNSNLQLLSIRKATELIREYYLFI